MTEKAGERIKMEAQIIIRIELKLRINCSSCCGCSTKKSTQNSSPEKQQSAILSHFLS